MSGMPYHLEKGPILSVLESFANDDVNRRKAALAALRANTPLVQVGVVDSTTLKGGPHPTVAALVAHINQHWFGMTKAADGSWQPQAAFDPAQPATTGHWQHYHGPVEQILRETLIRAAEVSLGIDHGAPIPAKPPQQWPVEFFWKCPQPWFEGWVTWRSHGGGQGQVTVILATPADTGVVLDSPLNGRDRVKNPTSIRGRRGQVARQGMWVVTATQHTQVTTTTTRPGPLGQWVLPMSMWLGTGPVVTVAPSEQDGGVAAGGRPYQT